MPKSSSKIFGNGVTKVKVTFNADRKFLPTINRKSEDDGDDDPAELNIYDEIGEDPWEQNKGLTDKTFAEALQAIRDERGSEPPLHLRVNSRGGDVSMGSTMMNMLNDWGNKIVTTIDGIAASTASWAFTVPADEVRAHSGSQMFAHDALGLDYGCMGNAEQMREHAQSIEDYADFLDKTSDQIAGHYARKTGKDKDEMRQMMKDETFLTGQEAKDLGLVDTLTDGQPARNFTTREINSMRKRLALNRLSALPPQGELKNHNNKTQENTVNRKDKIALLNQWGLNVKDEASLTDARVDELITMGKTAAINAVNPPAPAVVTATNADTKITQLEAQIAQLTALNKEKHRNEVTAAIDQLIKDDKLTANEREAALKLAMNETTGAEYLTSLNARPAMPPGQPPVGSAPVEITGEAFNDIQKFVVANTDGFVGKFIGTNAGNYLREDEYGRARIRKDMAQNARKAARAVSGKVNPKNREKILAAWNANTIDAGLQRQVIFTDFIEEFAVTLAPFDTFSKVYSNVPLEGTDTVDVPFYDLSRNAPFSWNPATGYAAGSLAGTAVQSRPIVIGGSGTNSGANAPAGTACDRKVIGLQFSSYELRRQPYVNWEQHAKLQANALAVGLVGDVIGRVIVPANFGASVKAVPAAQFSADDVADLTEKANGANWPQSGRWLVLDHRYLTPLLKDPTFKQYLSYGATDPIRMAKIKEAYGFENIVIVPNLNQYFGTNAWNTIAAPANSNGYGWINSQDGVLLATAPIMPTEDVLQLLTRYDLIVHPQIDLTLEHRRFANLTTDQSIWTVECNYGAEKGRASSLQLITSQ